MTNCSDFSQFSKLGARTWRALFNRIHDDELDRQAEYYGLAPAETVEAVLAHVVVNAQFASSVRDQVVDPEDPPTVWVGTDTAASLVEDAANLRRWYELARLLVEDEREAAR